MRHLLILFVHVIATLTRLLGPGGLRLVVAVINDNYIDRPTTSSTGS
jgi:hypothetical protein